ncbi:MAG: exodeoxyribonuclease III [Patescibacteria group bacterium]|nr:exodeoxyribonuclease III [Patescibacteria group bacterium]
MKIVSWNVNGLRSVYKKESVYQKNDFFQWLKILNADIICFQEIKARQDQLPFDLINVHGCHFYLNSSERPGYGGVAVYTKQEPVSIEKKIGWQKFDSEGRLLILKYPKFVLLNLYIPHGGRGKENLDYKLEVYRVLINRLEDFEKKEIILVGDFNVAREEIDLARPKDNQNNIMFTLEERKSFGELIDSGFDDSFRKFNKKGGNYSWWPYFNNARERNIGWRIDYIFTSKKLTPKLKNAFILKDVSGSDHCPVGVEMKI